MKKVLAIIFLLYLLAGCGTQHMTVVNEKPNFNNGNNATLVIIRDRPLPVFTINNYLDNKLIGETKPNMYFTASVSPGLHYVITECDNILAVQMNFKAGKVYYLHQDTWPGAVSRVNAGLSVMRQTEAKEQMKGCEYMILDKNNPGADLNTTKYEQAVKDYHIDIKKRPAEYKPFLEHPVYDP
jgi:hypothetical protein